MKLSVVMPTYNETREQIIDSIESILNQTYTDFEYVIVCDNPNNKEVTDVLEEYKIKDNRIVIVMNEKNMGIPYSLNRGVEVSKGQYIARMDADDYSFPNRFMIQMDLLEKENVDLVCSNMIVETETNTYSTNRKDEIDEILLNYCCIAHSSVIFKKQAFQEAGGYRMLQPAEDYDLWLRFLSLHKKMRLIEEDLVIYRYRSQGVSSSNAYEQMLMTEYCRQLYQERVLKGYDSCSKESYLMFLNKQGIKGDMKQYNKAFNMYLKGTSYIKKGNPKGICYLLLSFKKPKVPIQCIHRYIKKRIRIITNV
ncbi:glycosyltransferase family 2 protein [Tannockella kyphosi]|uniref:glycosyltransferase family 2 protein n=1 Tax=Tannockella kyphosi TaxID=2899121 RepID=UPI002011A367|nr:glycosyltransferase [Tannockella kyphosi]